MARLTAFLIACLCVAPVAQACSCIAPGPPCQEFWRVDAVFTGRVVEVQTYQEAAREGEGPAYMMRLVRFAVEEPFRGISGDEAEVVTGRGGGDCGFGFRVGHRYIVYAFRQQRTERLTTGICTRTRELAYAHDDANYARGLGTAKPTSSIFGRVFRYFRTTDGSTAPAPTPLAFIEVQIRGALGNTMATRTNAEGAYQFQDLPPGHYQVTGQMPEGLAGGEKAATINLVPKACAQVDFKASSDGRVRGRVLRSDGSAVQHARVELAAEGQDVEREPVFHGLTGFSDAEGKYEIRFVPTGRYVLGVNLSRPPAPNAPDAPFAPTYYPGVRHRADAAVIALGEGTKVEDADIQLGDPLTEQPITGQILGPDGRPWKGAQIMLWDPFVPTRQLGFHSAESDEDGRFSIRAFAGLKYLLVVRGKGTEPTRGLAQCAVVENTSELGPVGVVLAASATECPRFHRPR